MPNETLADRLRRTTEQMANFANVDMRLWNEHSNACLQAASALYWGIASQLTVEEAWTILCETPDITSPEEYPDHALITMEQLGSFMARASPSDAERHERAVPVGWRWKLPSDDFWQFTDGPEKPRLGLPRSTEAVATFEPIYAAPSPPAAVQEPVAVKESSVTDAIVAAAMLDAWNDICDDTACHPLDIKQLGRKKISFYPNHWASAVAMFIRSALSTSKSDPAPEIAAIREVLPPELLKLTFAIQHNPNCPSPWLVRLPGKSGAIDMKPYGDPLGLVRHQTGDILGFGKTLEEAARATLTPEQGEAK